MARKAPPKGAPRKRKAAAPKRKAQTPRAAAPAKRRGPSAYEKRIADYLRKHPGATRQEARGHKVREHITRRQREIDRLERFAEQQAARFKGADSEEILEALMVRYRRDGIGFLNRIERWIAQNNARYMAQPYVRGPGGKYHRESLGINLDTMSEAEELPPETFGYH